MYISSSTETETINWKTNYFKFLPAEIIQHIFTCLLRPIEYNTHIRDRYLKRWGALFASSKFEKELIERYTHLKICMLVCKRFQTIGSKDILWSPLAKLSQKDSIQPNVPIRKQIKFVHLHAKEFIFSFDKLIAQIERKVNQKVCHDLGWQLTYDYTIAGKAIYRRLAKLTGDQFSLNFGRVQGQQGCLGGWWNNLAGGVDSISIPKMQLHTYEDFSGGLCVYSGNNWEKDRKIFINKNIYSYDKHALDVLFYEPCVNHDWKSMEGQYTDRPNPFYVTNRAYWHKGEYCLRELPEGHPTYYTKEEIDQKIIKFLQENVLQPILSLEE